MYKLALILTSGLLIGQVTQAQQYRFQLTPVPTDPTAVTNPEFEIPSLSGQIEIETLGAPGIQVDPNSITVVPPTLGDPGQFGEQVDPQFQGTGVGSGNSDTRQAYIEGLVEELKFVTDPQVNSQEILRDSIKIIEWCQGALERLKHERNKAIRQLNSHNYDAAERILIDVLYAIALSYPKTPSDPGPYTRVMVDRALVLSKLITNQGFVGGGQRLDKVTYLNFLFSYVDFIIEIGEDFDQNWYVPYKYQYDRCYLDNCPQQFNFRDFEQRYVLVARRQLEFTSQLIEVTGRGNVRPLGRPKVYLATAQALSFYVANDLSESLYAYVMSCSIGDLKFLTEDLAAYLYKGSTDAFLSDSDAVTGTFSTLVEVIDDLETRQSCL